jgi:hypothetical protein
MSKINKILLAVVIFLVVVVGAMFWKQMFSEPSFYAVYLRNGELYFGRLTIFPSFGLKQVYFIQVNRDNSQSPLSIQKFSNIFWGPSDYLKINRNEVVWITKLNSSGQLYQLIKNNPDLTQSQAAPPQQPPAIPPPATNNKQ